MQVPGMIPNTPPEQKWPVCGHTGVLGGVAALTISMLWWNREPEPVLVGAGWGPAYLLAFSSAPERWCAADAGSCSVLLVMLALPGEARGGACVTLLLSRGGILADENPAICLLT